MSRRSRWLAVGLCFVVFGAGGVASAVAASPRRMARVMREAQARGAAATAARGVGGDADQVRGVARHLPGARAAHGVSVRLGRAVPWLARAESDTFTAGAGRLLTRVYPVPINYRARSGRYVPIQTRLVRSGHGFRQQANSFTLRLPGLAGGVSSLSRAGGWIHLSLLGARGRGRVRGAAESFGTVAPGVAFALASRSTGLGWQMVLRHGARFAPVRWLVHMSKGLRPRLIRAGVAFVNRRGRAVWVLGAPYAYVGGGRTRLATRVWLSHTPAGLVISMRLSSRVGQGRAATARAATAGGAGGPVAEAAGGPPVTIGGAAFPGTSLWLSSAYQTASCYVSAASPTTSFCGGSTNYVDENDHTLVNFAVSGNVPAHAQVLQSWVTMTLTSQSTTTAENVAVWQAGKPWTSLATWDSYDGSRAWATPGGDTSGPMADYQGVGASGDTGNSFYWNVTDIVQGWADQDPAQVDGLLFAPKDAGASNTLGFGTPAESSGEPALEVYYQPRMGDYPNARYTSQQLTDRTTAGVNVADGDLELANQDVHLAGVNGLDLNLGRYYNNLSTNQNAFGVGWSMAGGADTVLWVPFDDLGQIEYLGGTGDAEVFQASLSQTWGSPPGFDATVSLSGSGVYQKTDTYDATTITVLFRHSGVKENFSKPVGAGMWARLSSVVNRDGDTISYTYNGSGQLTSIKDSYGNTTTITWASNGYVSKVTLPDGRVYQYAQNAAGQLTSYTDPASQVTSYAYDGYGNLTQITTAQGNITKIAYDAGNTNEVTSLTRLIKPTDVSGPTWSYQYATASGTCPANAGWTQATVSDPNAHVTTYCTDDQTRITGSVDANGHSRSTCYTPAGYVSGQVSGLGTLTSFGYDANDSLTSIQQGGDQSQSQSPTCNGAGSNTDPGLSTSLAYGDTTNNPYLPTSITDPQKNTTTYGYDADGNPQNTTNGQTEAKLTYGTTAGIDFGTLASSQDADGTAYTTTYTATNGNITTVTPPAGTPLNPITISYDSANRIATISTVANGTGHEVDYTYDRFDRVTQALYKNASGATVATIGYTYDHDGNLIKRTDSAGTTSYSYDGLNRLTGQTLPDASIDTYGYDGAGNLTSLTDAGGKVTYGYDKADQLTSVTEPGAGSATQLTYDNDGNLLSVTYPSGASVVRTYNSEGQLLTLTDTYKTSSGQPAQLSWGSQQNPIAYTGSLMHQFTDQAGNTTTYTYDALNRLTEAKTTNGQSTVSDYQYTLDADGNMTTAVTPAGTTTYAYNPANEICWSDAGTSSNACANAPAGGHAFTYDSDGNQTADGNGLTLAYNALDQTTSITSAGTTTNLAYLGEGQQQLITDAANTLHNDALGLGSRTTSGQTTYYTRTTAGTPVSQRTPTGTYNYLYDPQGSVVGLTDSQGHLVDPYTYDPYGNQTENPATITVPNPFTYQAGYQTTPGLYHYGARYLNPTQQSWTQPDPLNQLGSLTQANRYSFVGDDPINEADPTGRCFLWVPCSVYHTIGHYAAGASEIIGGLTLEAGGAALTYGCIAGTRGVPDAERVHCLMIGVGAGTEGALLFGVGVRRVASG